MTRWILALALALPAVAGAEMWRWRDANGRLHYSNVESRIPSYASRVRSKLGAIGGEPIGPEVDVDVDEPMDEPPAHDALPEAPPVLGRIDGNCQPGSLAWLPHRAVSLDRPYWYGLDTACGTRLRDVEAWLRRAATSLELRKVGIDG